MATPMQPPMQQGTNPDFAGQWIPLQKQSLNSFTIDPGVGKNFGDAVSENASDLAKKSSAINPKKEKIEATGKIGVKQGTRQEAVQAVNPIQSAIGWDTAGNILEQMEAYKRALAASEQLDQYKKIVQESRTTPNLGPLMQYATNLTGDKGIMEAWNQVRQYTPEQKEKKLHLLEKYKSDVNLGLLNSQKDMFKTQLRDKLLTNYGIDMDTGRRYVKGEAGESALAKANYDLKVKEHQIARDTAAEKQRLSRITKLGDSMDSGAAGRLRSGLADISDITKKYENIPGWGLDSFLREENIGDSILSISQLLGITKEETAADIRKLGNAMQKLRADYTLLTSGKAFTTAEQTARILEIGEAKSLSDDALRVALENFRDRFAAYADATAKDYPDVSEEYFANQGYTPESVRGLSFRYGGGGASSPKVNIPDQAKENVSPMDAEQKSSAKKALLDKMKAAQKRGTGN